MKGGDFKSDFNTAIGKLQQTQQNVSSFISQNDGFSKQIVQNLADINTRIRSLSTKILDIRNTLAEKERDLLSKQNEISSNTGQVSELQRQIDESKTQQQAVLGSFLFMSPAILLSGFATPIENMPTWLQPVTFLIPLRYYLINAKGIFLKGMSIDIALSNIWPMILISIFTLIASSWLFRRRLE